MLLCAGIAKLSRAQQHFNVRNAMHSHASVITGVVEKDNKYYCSVAANDSINLNNKVGNRFLVFDQVGNKVIDSLYQLPDRYIGCWNTSFQPVSGGFILAALSADTSANYAIIIKYDSIGGVIMTKEIPKHFCTSHYYSLVTDFRQLEDKQWLMLSRIACKPVGGSLHHDIELTKLDDSFNVIWHKQIGDPAMDDAGWKLLIEPDGYLIAGGRNNIGQYQKNFTCQALLYKTDTAGNYKWHWLSDPSKKTFEAKDVIRTQDGGYIYCGAGDGYEVLSGDQSYSILDFRGWVEKLDFNRNSVWRKAFNDVYETTEFKRVIEDDQGRINLFGNKFERDSLGNNVWDLHTRGWFLMLDANGDSLRERVYHNVNSCFDNNSIFDAEQTSDGGFIMVGEATDKCMGAIGPIQRGWIVKVDSNGCLGPGDPQCWPAAVPRSPTAHQVTVYPNPVKEAWYINNKERKLLTIMIYDITGRIIVRRESAAAHTEINLSSYPSGIYLYKISGTEGIYLQGKILKE